MRMNIVVRNTELSDALRERIEKKVGKLTKFFDDEIEAQVRLSQERSGRNSAEITLNVGGAILRAEEISGDMYMSIDRATDKIVRQIRRHRTKLEKRLREGAFEALEGENAPAPEEEKYASLVRVKRFTMKPMSVEDAIAQMDMLGHSFFLFLNEKTGGACVVYRRLDGDVGMLEPENA